MPAKDIGVKTACDGGTFSLTPGQIFTYPHQQYHAGAGTFRTDASSLKITVDAQGLSAGEQWYTERLWVITYFPFVELESDGGTVVEDGAGSASFTVTRTGLDPNDPLHQPVLAEGLDVQLEDRSGEVAAPEVAATWGTDFHLPNTLSIPGGQISKTEQVTPIDDPDAEGIEVIAVAAGKNASYFAAPPGAQPATKRAEEADNVTITSIEFKYGNFVSGDVTKIVAVNGAEFNNYLRISGENLHLVSFLQYLNTSTWARSFANDAIDPASFAPHLPPNAPFINSNGWKLDWRVLPNGQLGEMSPTPLGNLRDGNGTANTLPDTHLLGPNPVVPVAGKDITNLAGGTRDFRVVFMDARVNDPQQPLAVFNWGYQWSNISYSWAAPDAPVAICASPTRNGAGAAMITGYGTGTGNFGGFNYQDWISNP